jgi:hypothetical protein
MVSGFHPNIENASYGPLGRYLILALFSVGIEVERRYFPHIFGIRLDLSSKNWWSRPISRVDDWSKFKACGIVYRLCGTQSATGRLSEAANFTFIALQ